MPTHEFSILKLVEGLTEQQATEFRNRLFPTLKKLRTQVQQETAMQNMLKEKFYDARKIMQKVAQARATHREAVQEVENKHQYTEEYKGKEKAKGEKCRDVQAYKLLLK